MYYIYVIKIENNEAIISNTVLSETEILFPFFPKKFEIRLYKFILSGGFFQQKM